MSNVFRTDALEGSFEVASATALFYLEKGVSLYPKRSFPDICSVSSTKFPRGRSPLTSVTSVPSYRMVLQLHHGRGNRPLPLVSSLVSLQVPVRKTQGIGSLELFRANNFSRNRSQVNFQPAKFLYEAPKRNY